jgi:hypothetical protein
MVGEFLLQFAPAGLLCWAGIGVGALVLARNRKHTAAGLAAAGPMLIIGGSALAFGALLFVNSMQHRSLGGALFGFIPCLIGFSYVRGAYVLIKHGAAEYGTLKAGLTAIVGALTATCIIVGAQAMDSRFVGNRLAALDTTDAEVWRAVLSSLNAYPLCGRRRCQRLICSHLVHTFPPQVGKSALQVPAPIDHEFQRAFGRPASWGCLTV